MLDAAFSLFARQGVAGSSITQIAAEAGLTKGAIYSNFASKDELVLTLLQDHAMIRMAAALAEVTDGPDPRAGLRGAGTVLVRASREDAAVHRILAEYFALSFRDPERRDGLRQRRRQVREAVTAGLAQLVERTGLTLRLSLAETAIVLFALSNGLGVESGIDPDAVADDILEKVLPLLVDNNDG